MIKLKNILSEIVVKPTDSTKKLKQDLVNALYDECLYDFDGNYSEWLEFGFDSFPYYSGSEIQKAYQALEDVIGITEAVDFYYQEAPLLVKQKFNAKDLKEIIVKPTERKDYVGQNFSREKDLRRTAPEVKIDWESEPTSMRLRDENGYYYYYGGLDQYGRYWSAQAYDNEYESEFKDIQRDPDNDSENLEEIVIKPTDQSTKLKRDLVNALYQDCIDSYKGEYSRWVGDVESAPKFNENVKNAVNALVNAIGEEEAVDYFWDEALELVKLKISNKEELD